MSKAYRSRNRSSILGAIAIVAITASAITAPVLIQSHLAPVLDNSKVAASPVNWTALQTILSRDTSTTSTPPTATPDANIPDGPLLGNGHMTAAVGGTAAAQTYYLGATDFWQDTAPKAIGGVSVSIPSLASATGYQQQQDILNAEVRSTFTTSTATVTERSWVSANEDLMVLSLTNASTSTASPAVSVATFTGAQTALPTTSGLTSGNTMWATRTTNGSTWTANAALASRVLNGSGVTYSTNSSTSATGAFTLNPGQTVQIVTALGDSGGNVSGSPWPAPATLSAKLSAAQARVAQLNVTSGDANSVLDADALHSAHLGWWKNFWVTGANIDLGGGSVERYWYTSLYAMAISNRSGVPAPSMGNFVTNDTPIYGGNWTNDYNFQMPYQGLYAANHIELSQPYERGVMDCLPHYEALATSLGYHGAVYGNNMHQGGQCDDDLNNMKGNAAWLATNFVNHWNYTHDATWAAGTGYPYLIQVSNFWDNYLTKTSGVYNITGSAQNETSSYQLNPIGDLAWLHYMYPALIQMSQALGVDSTRRGLWQDISTNLAPYPTFTNLGHTDFKATQDAPGFYGNDANPANAVFPGNTIDLGSASLFTAQNTIQDLGVWCGETSFAWIFPAAARAGLPDTYKRLTSFLGGGCANAVRPQPGLRGNSTVVQSGGGAETFGGMETVNSMLLTGLAGPIRLFPDWPHGRDASFSNMLAGGAFTVTSSVVSGTVGATTLTSNAGATAAVASPWSPGTVAVTDTTTGASVSTTLTRGNVVSFPTTAGHSYQLTGSGTYDYTRLNLATSGTVSASSSYEAGGWGTAKLNDGIEASASGDNGWTSGAAGAGANHTEWAQVDLGSAQPLNEVDLFPRNDSGQVGQGFPVDFTIAVSNDGSTWTPVVTKTGYALPSGVQAFPFPCKTARYVRVTGTTLRPNPTDGGLYQMQLAEMKVFAPTDLAMNATPSASSSYEASGWSIANINDRSRATGWTTDDSRAASNHTEWVQLDEGSATNMSEVDLYPRSDSGQVGQGFPVDFTIAVSNDGSTWTPVVTKTGYALPSGVQAFPFPAISARYVRVTGTTLRPNPTDGGLYQMQLADMNVFAPTDLALTATPSASSNYEGSGFSLANINDRNQIGGWTSGAAGQGSNHTEWVQLDEGSATTMSEVDLYPRMDGPNSGHANDGQGFPIDFTIAVSNDASTWTPVVTKTGYALPSGVQAFSFPSTSARYVRVTGTTLRPNPNDGGLYQMQLAEIAVFAPNDLALSATPSASSSYEGSGWSLAYINDGHTTTGWTSGAAGQSSNHTEWVQLDEGSMTNISEVSIYPRTDSPNGGQGFPVDFTIAVSNNGSTWTPVVTKTGYALPSGVQAFSFPSTSARYVRVTGTTLRPNPNDGGLYQMQLEEIVVQQ